MASLAQWHSFATRQRRRGAGSVYRHDARTCSSLKERLYLYFGSAALIPRADTASEMYYDYGVTLIRQWKLDGIYVSHQSR